MQIKCGTTATAGTNATVALNSGDHLSVAYTDPRGKSYIVNISAQHLVLIVSEEETEAAMIIGPVGARYIEGSK